MNVVQLKIEELDDLVDLAEKFYASSEFLNGFKKNVAKKSWVHFIDTGIGVIFGLKEDNELHGMLGAIKSIDAHTGDFIAVELFWFVSEEKRGEGLKLIKAYEKWALEQKCKRIAIGHLQDLMPARLEKIYNKLGYKLAEKSYVKEVS